MKFVFDKFINYFFFIKIWKKKNYGFKHEGVAGNRQEDIYWGVFCHCDN